MENEEKSLNGKHIALIIGITFLVYANIFANEFAYDDHVFIENNLEIRDAGNIPGFFSQDTLGLYRPLRQVLYVINYAVWKESPFGYHLQSLIFHMLNSLLVFLIAKVFFKKANSALFAALIFAVHPIHTERVTNMTAGFDQLGILFFLAAFYLYLMFSQKAENKYILASILIFILGLLSSEEAITLFLVIFSYDYFISKKWKSRLNYYIPYIAISVIYIWYRFIYLDIGARAEGYTPYIMFLSMTAAFVKYMYLLIIPLNLSVQQSVILREASLLSPTIILKLLVPIALLAVVLLYRNKRKILSFWVLWFFLTFLPMLNIIPIQTVIAERYLYLPSVSFCILLVYGWNQIPFQSLLRTGKKITPVLIMSLLVLTYGIRTIDRNADWRNDIELWKSTIDVSPESSLAYDNLGYAYEQQGKIPQALVAFQTAIALDPQNFKAHANMGAVALQQEQYDVAAFAFNKSIEINPDYARAHNYLGLTYHFQGLPNEAIIKFIDAVRIDNNFYEAYNNLGIVYASYGELARARQAFAKALDINPLYEEARFNLELSQEPEKPRSITK